MKKILAIALSIAILVMAMPISVFADTPSTATDTWDGTFTEPTETDAEGNIVINTAEEMAWVALRGDTATAGKSYKVADGVESFDMSGAEGITADSTADDVQAATKTDKIWRYEADNKVGGFCGNFDGNGVVIYNIYATGYGYGSLFPYVYCKEAGVTIQNVVVKASFISGYHSAAGIVGQGEHQNTITVKKCMVQNCYIGDNGNTNPACNRAAAAFVAQTGNSSVSIESCLAMGNTISAAGYEAGFVAKSGDYTPNGISISTSVSIGMSPYTTAKLEGALGKGITEKLTVAGVYSDVACDVEGFITLTTAQMQGAAAKDEMLLPWGTDFVVGDEGEYPSVYYGEPIIDPYLWDGTCVEPTETDADGNVVINTASEFAWVALQGGEATADKSYKVADGITYFNMNGMLGVKSNSTAEEVKAASKNSAYLWANDANFFMGNFDGNGVTVYNINAAVAASKAYTGLFTVVKPENTAKAVTIKNITVAASYFEGYHYNGGIVGFAQNNSSNSGCINVDSCATKNCYFYDTVRQHNSSSGLILGQVSHNSSNVTNCLAVNNISDMAKVNGGIIGTSSDYISTQNISDCVVIGSLPYSTVVEGSNGKVGTRLEGANLANIYTDQTSEKTGYTTIDADNLVGYKATLNVEFTDADKWFFTATTYPQPAALHNVVDGVCADCGLVEATDPCTNGHTLEAVAGVEATDFTNGLKAHDKCSACSKLFIDGVEVTADELVIPMFTQVWDGTFAEPTETDENGNIVINTPAELAWVALRGGEATAGKNYIVAKDSVFNLNGMVDITAFSTVEDVKAAVKNENYKWQIASDTTNASVSFAGNFDGNGLIVYNIYTGKGRSAGGLFPIVLPAAGGSVSVKNVTVLSSHIGGYHYAGGVIGYANAPGTDTKLYMENCVVKNTFIYDNGDTNPATQKVTGSLIGHLTHNAATINNCLVADNEILSAGIIGGLFGNTSIYGAASTVSNVVSIGTSVQPLAVDTAISEKVANTVYTNVYTDQSASASGITVLDTELMMGAAAVDNMNLNWNVNWAAGAEGEYPSLILDNSDFYDEWDGTFVEPSEIDENNNYVINTAEEMAWVALNGGAATEGKNYKVADGIKYFNMNGMAGVTLYSTADDVKAATKNEAMAWKYVNDDKTAAFKGNFDGNGVTIYNIYTAKGRGYAGLFPVIYVNEGTTLSFKNVAVVASHIGGYHAAGTIIGYADTPVTSTSISVSDCAVKNCYIYDNDDTNPATAKTVGTLVGNLTHNAATITNCLVVDNVLSAKGILGGLFGNTSAYAAPSTVSNVVSIGATVAPVSVEVTVSDKVAITSYTNVYTDQTEELEGVTVLSVDAMTGTELTLDWTAWFATTDLPELRVFHNITATDNGDGTHDEYCADCNAQGMTVEHVFVGGECVCGATDDVAIDYGDVNGDGTINGRDYGMLMQYLNDYEVAISLDNADVNGDGNINGRDYGLLMQYLNDYDIVFGS